MSYTATLPLVTKCSLRAYEYIAERLDKPIAGYRFGVYRQQDGKGKVEYALCLSMAAALLVARGLNLVRNENAKFNASIKGD